MTYPREQIQAAYKKLSSEIKSLIMSNETTELIATTLKEVGLSEEQINLADSEILYSMFCLQSLDEAINNIAKLSNKNVNDLSKVKATLQNEIFRKYKIDIDDFVKANKSQSTLTASASVPEIAPNNLPMVEDGEVAHGVPHVEQKVDDQQPVVQTAQPNKLENDRVQVPDYRYEGGKDPYREPLV